MTITFFVSILLFILLTIKLLWSQYEVWRWKSRLNLNKHLYHLQAITEPINGFHLSKRARVHNDAMAYVYGEIDTLSFIALLSLTKPNPHTVFYDLGSGVGKTVLACAMVFEIKKSCGIELFSTLDSAANQQLQALHQLPIYQQTTQRILFICADFLETNFDDATLIYINATGYFSETWAQLNHRLECLPSAPIIITTTKPLPSKQFTIIHQTKVQMSWGIVDAYIQTKTHSAKKAD